MKKEQSFLDLDFVNWKTVPAWLREGKKQMEKGVNLCPSYAPNCPSCRVWVQFLELAHFFED